MTAVFTAFIFNRVLIIHSSIELGLAERLPDKDTAGQVRKKIQQGVEFVAAVVILSYYVGEIQYLSLLTIHTIVHVVCNHFDCLLGFRGDSNLSLPVRQTASIFKQPVTVIRSHPDSKVRHDLKHGPADSQQPRQLFWERSLTGVKITDVTEDTLGCIGLPSKIQGK